MNFRRWLLPACLAFSWLQTPAQSSPLMPVTPNATPEAAALLQYFDSISGQHTLSGQHCAPIRGSQRLGVVHRLTGRYPAVYGQDFGFSYPGYWDGINYRQDIVDEAIRRHSDGFIITLMWHAVPPTMDEPVTFSEGIQSQLSDAEWQELITPGTHLNERWKSQVDVIAWFLKQLQAANVPVLWRPYHEMNGGWFWWGKKPGENGYKKLYRMLYDRFVNFHGLNNLLWVYNTNEVKLGVDSHAEYYPGDDVVDVLATDVYTEKFSKKNYEALLELAGGKPIALGEVGETPPDSVLRKQPQWAWFMLWHDPDQVERNPFQATYENEQVYTLKDLPWVEVEEFRMHYPFIR